MSAPRTPQLGVLLGLLLGTLGLLACGSPVVGAECAPGFSLCGERCLDLQNDPDHCGGCDHGCGRFECRDGKCGPDLRADADAGSDGGVLIVDGLPFLPDGGFSFPDVGVGRGCKLGQGTCGEGCKDLRYDETNCGECGRVCPAGEYCFLGDCIMCDAPLQRCGGGCVDVQTHPNFCGGCKTTCRSGICEGGACSDVLPGHVVLIGHDYAGARPSGTAMRLVGNAVFLATGKIVRTVVFEGTAAARALDGVNEALDYVVARDGREWAPRSVAADELGSELFDADVLLVLAQASSSDARLQQLGQSVGLALTQFLLRGGVIVVLEAPGGANAGTFQLLEPSGLFEAESREAIVDQNLQVATPGIGVAARTTRTYRTPSASVRFLGVTSPGTQVVRDRDGESVVFHRIVLP